MTAQGGAMRSATASVQADAAQPEQLQSPHADLRQSIGWMVFGLIVIVLSWRMDRLERQDINPYTVPGLLPGCLGIAVVLFGSLMGWRSWRRLREHGAPAVVRTAVQGVEARRIAIVLALCIGYAAGLMGHGLPFWLATSVFVSTAIGVLQFSERKAKGQRARGIVFALIVGVATGVATTFLFQDLFLVRLP